jgi:DNA processing protein
MRLGERQARMVLSGLPDWGPVSIRQLLDAFSGSAVAALEADAASLLPICGRKRTESLLHWERHFDLARQEAFLERENAVYLTEDAPAYPGLLRQIHDAPVGLYCTGPALTGARAVAIVGTRRPSAYGRKLTRTLAAGLAEAGLTIVSGLAAGVDAEAHSAALDAGGSTVGVLGNGLNIVYPRENAALFRRMRAEGAVMSEFYFGRVADRQTFPQRNRIVSGMCEAVIVIESGASGGSLITARFAGEQGRTVMAVPGRVDMETSHGCHRLIRDGATLITSVADVLEDLNFRQAELPFSDVVGQRSGTADNAPPANLADEEKAVLEPLLGGDALHPDHICDRTGLASFTVNAALLMLEMKGAVAKRPDGTYERAF